MLHPDLDPFRGPGGLFDLDLTDLHSDIGKRCRFIDPTCPAQEDIHVIVAVQRIYTGEIAYRVQSSDNDFGRPAREDEVEILED